MKGLFLKLSILAYTIFVIRYNLFAVTRSENHYYLFENVFMFMMLFMDYKSSTVTDKMFINYTRILTGLMIICLLLSSFQDGIREYGFVISTSSVVLSIFGSLIALYLEIRREKL